MADLATAKSAAVPFGPTLRGWPLAQQRTAQLHAHYRAQLVLNGQLAPVASIHAAAEGFWAGVGAWAEAQGLTLVQSLYELLAANVTLSE